MKKLKILSVLLAVLTALTCFSAVSTSAALIKSISSIEISDVPDDIYTKSPEEMLYGVQIKVNYTDSSSKTFTVSADNVEYEDSSDYIDSHAYSDAFAKISLGLTSYATIEAYNYVGDFIQLHATAYKNYSYDVSYEAEKKLDYPEDYDLPEIFCNDYLVYRNNPDDTLTLVNHSFIPYYFYFKEDYEEPVVIPETIHGKTVTAVADYALLGTYHPYSVTIPNTVTSIGDYAFGYCFNNGFYSDNHDVPDNVSASRLTQKLADAGDDDTFIVCINFYSEDAQALSDTLQAEYLSECADYEYDADMEVAYATLTKAQIYSMQDVDDICMDLLYERDSYISEEIYDFAEYAGNDTEMYVEFEVVYAETDDELDSLCEELSNKYFGGRTDYTVDYDSYAMRVNATFNEIKAVSEDDAVGTIRFYGADGISYDLYKALYFEDDDYLTDIFVEDYSEENLTSNFTEYADTYFADCEYEIFNFEGEELLIIKGASKQQIFEASQDNNFIMNLFDYPLIRHYNDIVIYGENGSAAQTYAENNSIEFVGTGSQYQLGDVNLDSVVNVTDATEILKYNVELVKFTGEQKALADFDGNGIINVSDVSELQRAIVNS